MVRAVCRDCIEPIAIASSDHANTRPSRKHACTIAQSQPCPHCGSRRVLAHRQLPLLDIAHIDCDAFYASVEKRDNPALADKPLIVGHAGGRGVVTTACYIARRYGIGSAMPMFKAIEACPDAVVIKPDMAKYKAVSRQLRDIFRQATPIIEPISLDEAYLDLRDGVRTDRRAVALLLADMAQRIETHLGISVSIGLSVNKFLAKLASDLQKPRGFSLIGPAEAQDFLAPLPVVKIMGVGKATAQRMEAQGLHSIGDLQHLPEQQLSALFGKFGRRLARFSKGQDDRQVSSHRLTKSVSAETTFVRNSASPIDLKSAAGALCERVAGRLQQADLAGGAVVLKLKTADFTLLTRTQRLAHPTQRCSVLQGVANSLIDRQADGRSFRLIGIGAADIVSASEADPPDLFDA